MLIFKLNNKINKELIHLRKTQYKLLKIMVKYLFWIGNL